MEASLKSKRFPFEYEPCHLTYTIYGKYTPDFRIGRDIYLEVKGKLDYPTRRKMVAVKREHPEKDIRIVFMRDNKIKGTKMTYGSWAEKNGFPWSVFPAFPFKKSETLK